MAFIVFEGLDGSGKSTLIELTCKELERLGQTFVKTREPGGTPLAEDIRQLLLRTDLEPPVSTTELLLYAASRAQHVARVIAPSLESGDWVLCDRFSESTVAFQCFARGLSRPDVDWLNRFAEQGRRPDLVVLLDLSVEESARRITSRVKEKNLASDRMEREEREFHERVRQGYLTQSRAEPWRWLVLEATKSSAELFQLLKIELVKRQWLSEAVARKHNEG
jgi:dTMP kinase